jgi:hypothetical protein
VPASGTSVHHRCLGPRAWLLHAQDRYHGRSSARSGSLWANSAAANSVFVNKHESTRSSPSSCPRSPMGAPVGRSSGHWGRGSHGSGSGSSGSGRRDHTLGDHRPPAFRQDPSGAPDRGGWLDSRRHGRRDTFFQPRECHCADTPAASTPTTPAVRLAAQLGSAQASPDVYPPGADLMALLLESEELTRRQADALRQQDDELSLLRSGGRSTTLNQTPHHSSWP